jgi:hypothetical protein
MMTVDFHSQNQLRTGASLHALIENFSAKTFSKKFERNVTSLVFVAVGAGA